MFVFKKFAAKVVIYFVTPKQLGKKKGWAPLWYPSFIGSIMLSEP